MSTFGSTFKLNFLIPQTWTVLIEYEAVEAWTNDVNTVVSRLGANVCNAIVAAADFHVATFLGSQVGRQKAAEYDRSNAEFCNLLCCLLNLRSGNLIFLSYNNTTKLQIYKLNHSKFNSILFARGNNIQQWLLWWQCNTECQND